MRRPSLLPLVLLGAALAAPPAPAAIDPFYRDRMDSGVRAFEVGDWDQAARQLRIACFGHLDEPVALAGGLVRLAVTEARRGDEDSFRRVFSRLLQLEQQFGAYSAADLPASLGEQFEALAAQLVPADGLRGIAGFRGIAERAARQRLAELPPDRRRAELEALLQTEPERPEWLIELARLELALGRPRPALGWLDRLPETAAATPPATCLRQQAASEAADCAAMDASRPFCPNVPPAIVEFRLQCLIAGEAWEEAARLLGGLEPATRSRRRIARLERRVRKSFEGPIPAGPPPGAGPADAAGSPAGGPAAAPAPTASPGGTPTQGSAADPGSATAPGRPAPAPLDPRRLEGLRQRLETAATAAELAALRADAEALAGEHPEARAVRLLAAEVAYLESDWPAVVGHFRRAGPLAPEEAQLAFYQAVALYETGDIAAAAALLRPVLPRLERNGFVDSYVERILRPGS